MRIILRVAVCVFGLGVTGAALAGVTNIVHTGEGMSWSQRGRAMVTRLFCPQTSAVGTRGVEEARSQARCGQARSGPTE